MTNEPQRTSAGRLDNVRPDRALDRSNSHLAGHFDRSLLDGNLLKYFPYSCRFNAFCSITL